MKKFSKITVILASLTLLTGCINTGSKPTKEQLIEAIELMASLKNYTTDVSLETASKDVGNVPFIEASLPRKITYIMSSKQEFQEEASKSASSQTKAKTEVNLEEARTYIKEEYEIEVTLAELIEEAKKYTPKKDETYMVNEQTGMVTYEQNLSSSSSESYSIYDKTAKQYYSVYKDEDEYHFSSYTVESENETTTILGLFSVDELLEKGEMDPNSGVLYYEEKGEEGNVMRVELRFTLVDKYLEAMDIKATSNESELDIALRYSKIGTTSFAVPKVTPTCDYDHNINHTPGRWVQYKEGHRYVCQQCSKFLGDGIESHEHSHNNLGMCEKCGYQIGLNEETVDLGDDIANQILKLKASSESSELYCASESYDYDVSTTEYNDGVSTRIRLYQKLNAITRVSYYTERLVEGCCVRIYRYSHEIYSEVPSAVIEAASNREWDTVKEALSNLTPSYSGQSYSYSHVSHNNKPQSECEKVQINSCRDVIYITCKDCGLVTNVDQDVHHNSEHIREVNTPINQCVTKQERICSDCQEVISSYYQENHEHRHGVFATKLELANFGIDASKFEPHYKNPIFYFTYCDDCHQIGNYYDSNPYIYEVDSDYKQEVNHENYDTKAYELSLKKDEKSGKYVLNNPSYSYESSYAPVPHHFVDDVCTLCGLKVYHLPDPLITIRACNDEETGIRWTYLYYESEDSDTQYSFTPYTSASIVDHVLTYEYIWMRDQYYSFKEYYNEDDTKVIKLEVYNMDFSQLLLTIE